MTDTELLGYIFIMALIATIINVIIKVIKWWRSPVELTEEEFLNLQDNINYAVQELKKSGWTQIGGNFSGANFEKLNQSGENEYLEIKLQLEKNGRRLKNYIVTTIKDEHGRIETKAKKL